MYEASKVGFRSPRYFKSGNSTPNSSSKGFRRKSSLIKLGRIQKNQQYHPQNNNKLNKNSVYYDSSNPIRDESFQNSIPTNQSQQSYSMKKSLRQSEYSNSGFYNDRKRYEHKIMIMSKQIQKLKKQIQTKDKQLSILQQNKSQFKMVEMELVQTYRVINYYEGKIKQHQKITSYYESLLDTEYQSNKSKTKLKQGLDFKQIIQFFRNQSINLKAQSQKTNHQNTKLIVKIQKLQSKYINLQKVFNQNQKFYKLNRTHYQTTNLQGINQTPNVKTIYQAKLQSSQNKIAKRRNDDQVSMTSSIKSYSSQKSFQPQNGLSQTLIGQQKHQLSKIYGNFNSKINKIQKQLDFFKIENDKLQTELNQKIILIGKLTFQNDQLKYILQNGQGQQKNKSISNKLSFKKEQNQSQQKNNLNLVVSNMQMNFLPIKKKQSSNKQSTRQSNKQKNPLIPAFNNISITKQKTKDTQKRKKQLKNLSLNQISKKLQQTQSKSYKFKQVSPQTIRKLRYNLIREDITYTKLLQTIVQKLVESQDPNEILQVLQDVPYQLTSKQSSSFVFEYKKIDAYIKEKQLNSSMKNTNQPNKDLSKQQRVKIMKQKVKQIFKQNILPFKNITLRRDASLTSQLTKTFKNRLAQLEPYMRDKKKGIMSFEQAQKKFRQEWNLGDEQIDFIFLKSCQETQQYNKFDFYKTINFFLEN